MLAILAKPALPLPVTGLTNELTTDDPSVQQATRVYDRFEPLFGSFKLHTVEGQVCSKHINGGGLVALTARVEPTVFVAEGAAILDRADVRDQVRVEDHAIIDGDARVTGRSRLRHETHVGDQAVLEERVLMQRHASVGGNAHLRGMISLDYYVFVGDESRLFGNMHLE